MERNFKHIAVSQNINADSIQEKIFEITHSIQDPDEVFKFYVELHDHLEGIHKPLVKTAQRISFMENVLGVTEYDKVNEPKLKNIEHILESLSNEGVTYEIKNHAIKFDNGDEVIEFKSKDRFNKLIINGVLDYIEKVYK